MAERPIMLYTDIALVCDLSDYMHLDENGVKGSMDCTFQEGQGSSVYVSEEERSPHPPRIWFVQLPPRHDNEGWLMDFEKVLDKMLRNGYLTTS